MMTGKTARDIMVDIFKYPHIHSGLALRQAIEILKKSVLEGDKCIKPIIALVLDERGLIGTLRLRDVLKGLEPNFLQPSSRVQGYSGDKSELFLIWDSLFDRESRNLIERPVTDVMSPIIAFVSPDDSIIKAAYLMIRNDLLILPVIENGKKLVGLIRMIELFDVLAGVVLEEAGDNTIDIKAQA